MLGNNDILLEYGDGSTQVYVDDKLDREQRSLAEHVFLKLNIAATGDLQKDKVSIAADIEYHLKSLEQYELCLLAHYITSYCDPNTWFWYKTVYRLILKLLQADYKRIHSPTKPPTYKNTINFKKAKESIKCEEVAERFGVKLQKAGSNLLKGLCPFHNEKTPSFFIRLDKNTYKCYGCNKWGDSINLLDFFNKG